MHLRWPFLMACSASVLAQQDYGVHRVSAAKYPALSPATGPEASIYSNLENPTYPEYPNYPLPENPTYGYPSKSVCHPGTVTFNHATTRTEYITVTDTFNVTTTVQGPTITEYTTCTETFTTISLVPTTEISLQPTTEISLVPTTVELTETFLTTEISLSVATSIYTSVTTSLATVYVPTPIIVSGTPLVSTQTVVSTLTETLTLADNVTQTVPNTVQVSLPGSTQTVVLTKFTTATLPASTVLVTITLPQSTLISTLTLPASTSVSAIFVTKSYVMTQIVPTTVIQSPVPTSSSTSPASNFCASNCQIDVTATQLAYPGTVVFSTVEVPIVTLYIVEDAAGSSVSSSLFTSAIPPDPPLTWEYSGVPLTYPTLYAAYETFSRISVEPVGTVCISSTLTLALPSPTAYEPLIVFYSDIPNTDFVAPTVVSYLNSLETVTQQLGQTIGAGACDPLSQAPLNNPVSSRGTTTMLLTRSTIGTVTKTVAEGVPLPTSVAQLSDMLPPSSAPQPSSSPRPTNATAFIPSNTPPPVFSASVVSILSELVPASSMIPLLASSSAVASSSSQASSSVSVTMLPSSSSRAPPPVNVAISPSSGSQAPPPVSITISPSSSSQAPPPVSVAISPSSSSQAPPPVSITMSPSSSIQTHPPVSDIASTSSSVAFSSSNLADSTSQDSVPLPESSSMGIYLSSTASIVSSVAPTRSTTNAVNGTRTATLSISSPLDFTGGAAAPTGHIAGLLLGAAGFGLGLF